MSAAEIASLRAELAQARADARVLAGHWFGSVGGFFVDVEGLTDAEAKVLTTVAYEADDLPREAVLAVIRRALGGAA